MIQKNILSISFPVLYLIIRNYIFSFLLYFFNHSFDIFINGYIKKAGGNND